MPGRQRKLAQLIAAMFTAFLVVGLAFSEGVTASPSPLQPSSTTVPRRTTPPTSAPTGDTSPNDASAQKLLAEITALQQESSRRTIAGPEVGESTEVLEGRVENLERSNSSLYGLLNIVLIPMSILIGLLALGGAMGVVFSVRDQRRMSQLHELSVAGETASQSRSADSHSAFLDASRQTLTLVNDTLALAKDASERAAQTMQLKATSSMASIDEEAQTLLDVVRYENDFKRIVVDPDNRQKLQAVASELAAIEGYLELQDVRLSAPALLMKGLDRHLANDARAALRFLRAAAQETKDRDLRALAYYWMAYINNNQGHFRDAIEIFTLAEESVTKPSTQWYELQRIRLESTFFELGQSFLATNQTVTPDPLSRVNSSRNMVDQLIGLSQSATDEASVKSISATLGNIYSWQAGLREVVQPGEPHEAIRRTALEAAKNAFAESGSGIWPKLGAIEADYILTGNINSDDYHRAEDGAMDQLRRRAEPRNVANIYQTLLIVKIRLGSTSPKTRDLESLKSAYEKVQAALGHVDETTTIFSQLSKCNLSRDLFLAEVSEFYALAANKSKPASNSRTNKPRTSP